MQGRPLRDASKTNAACVTGRDDLDEIDSVYERLLKGEQVFGEAVLRRKDGVVATIKYRAMNGKIGELPVLVSITHEVSTFTLRT